MAKICFVNRIKQTLYRFGVDTDLGTSSVSVTEFGLKFGGNVV